MASDFTRPRRSPTKRIGWQEGGFPILRLARIRFHKIFDTTILPLIASRHSYVPTLFFSEDEETRDEISSFEPSASASVGRAVRNRSEEHTSELQSPCNLVC